MQNFLFKRTNCDELIATFKIQLKKRKLQKNLEQKKFFCYKKIKMPNVEF